MPLLFCKEILPYENTAGLERRYILDNPAGVSKIIPAGIRMAFFEDCSIVNVHDHVNQFLCKRSNFQFA